MPYASGMFAQPGDELSTAAIPASTDPVGIVADSFEDVFEYLDLGGIASYVIIRTVADVPPRLGGIALLTSAPIPPELADALTEASLGGS